jgi:hypothetical protein
MPSAGFVLRIRCASSSVIRCSRVSLSVIEPVVAFPTPATSEPIAPCGRCFASIRKNLRICLAGIIRKHTFCSLSCGLKQCLSKNLGPRDHDLDDKFWGRLEEEDIRGRCAKKNETRDAPCCTYSRNTGNDDKWGHGICVPRPTRSPARAGTAKFVITSAICLQQLNECQYGCSGANTVPIK